MVPSKICSEQSSPLVNKSQVRWGGGGGGGATYVFKVRKGAHAVLLSAHQPQIQTDWSSQLRGAEFQFLTKQGVAQPAE